MMLLYNLSIFLYRLLAIVASPFNAKAKKAVEDRKASIQALQTKLENNQSPIIWFHAASLGEFEQGLPVMEQVKAAFPEHKLLVTFFSPSGFDHRKNHPVADFTSYLPWDTSRNARAFVKMVNPKKVVFIKYEYWYHHLKTINNLGIPLVSISALFTEKHIFFKPYGGLYRQMLRFFEHTFVQNESSEALLQGIGIKNVSVSGDTRFDRVQQTIANPAKQSQIETFLAGKPAFIVGSAWPEDMEVLATFINEHSKDIKVIIAPHLVDDAHVAKIEGYLKDQAVRYTEFDKFTNEHVLILNTIGMLSNTYQYGSFAYIGGAFGDGLHNILEAVAFGLPVVYGNKGLEKFPESIELQEKGGGFSIETAEQAQAILNRLLNENEFRNTASATCKQYVNEKAGATNIIMDYLRAI
ncbi:3-deoxy-D-manno-octulosonic acid transferase [Roseivirga pacifica]|uniref:3-deoxy-D-manno-octulosonic acid transferase n=1 Tax=Roseivirga pacifica TaxID=1267423 RepID=UPI003BB21161